MAATGEGTIKGIGTGVLGAAASLFVVGIVSASAQEATDPSDAAPTSSVELQAEEIVAARRAAFFLSTQAIGQIKAGIEEGGDLRRTRAGAMMLANWAKALPTLFPEGTDL